MAVIETSSLKTQVNFLTIPERASASLTKCEQTLKMTQIISQGKKRVDELFELLNSAITNHVDNVERASEH
jgi:hypothetical protein